MVIKYISSKTTTLKVDGETYKVPVVSGTVSDLLDAANVDLGSNELHHSGSKQADYQKNQG